VNGSLPWIFQILSGSSGIRVGYCPNPNPTRPETRVFGFYPNPIGALVEFVLNHTPRRNLAGFAPITVFTNLQPESPLDSLLDTFTPPANLPTDAAAIRSRIIHLEQTLAEMHKRVSATRDNRRNRSRQAHNSQTPNFSEGDFVLFGVRDDSNRARRSKLSVR